MKREAPWRYKCVKKYGEVKYMAFTHLLFHELFLQIRRPGFDSRHYQIF
jgi:hypothetical protein